MINTVRGVLYVVIVLMLVRVAVHRAHGSEGAPVPPRSDSDPEVCATDPAGEPVAALQAAGDRLSRR